MANQKRSTRTPARATGAKPARKGLSRAELARQQGSDLPGRDAMSLINLNAAIPVNAAIAANVLSDGSVAYADALQDTPITQGN
jgi:hypothetical protein